MKHLIIGTAGHVDHGKTALIKALTAIDCDTHKEEKERGITINLGFSHLTLPNGDSFGIVDVPGHKDFIKTMVAGAYGIDIVLLVVAADSGIMPQTKEHIQIIEMLGVKHAIVALNKADLVDEEMLELAELDVADFLDDTSLKDAPIVPVSSLTGNGIDQLVDAITKMVSKVEERKASERFRMYIDRIFNVKGIGFVVTGSVLEGTVKTGQDLYLLPGHSKKVKVRNIERHGETTSEVHSGDRSALNLSGLKQEDFTRGMIISNIQLEETKRIDAVLTIFDESTVLSIWTDVVFYTGTFECAAKVHLLDKDQLSAGETAIVQIHLSKAAILINNDRFIIRNTSNTLTYGGGQVIDNSPLHHKRRTDKLLKELRDLVDATVNSDNLISIIKLELNKLNRPVFAEALAELLHQPINSIVEECRKSEQTDVECILLYENAILLRTEKDEEYRQQVLIEIETWHKQNPILTDGLEPNELYGKFGFKSNDAGKYYVEHLFDSLLKENKLKKSGNSFALKNHEVKIAPQVQKQLEWLETEILNVGQDKPNPEEIAEKAHQEKINREKLKMMLTWMGKEAKLIFHQSDYIHATIADKNRRSLLELIDKKADGINEKEFRELIGGTKKLVQMLLGIFIEEGIITKPKFYILITEKGKNWLKKN